MTQAETEVWYRNPQYYIKECVEAGVTRIAWDRPLLVMKRLDPHKFMSLYYGQLPHEYLIIDDMGTQHFVGGVESPVAVYPTWEYGDDWALLEELCTYNPGEDEEACSHRETPAGFRPRFGQEHRVVILNAPPASTGVGRKFYRSVSELQDEFPDVKIHVNGSHSFNIMFGLSFRSVDFDPRIVAKKGKIYLPNGRDTPFEKAFDVAEWVTLLGYRPVDMQIPRNRCIFNIKSAEWAARFFKQELKFKFKFNAVQPPDSDIPDAEFKPTAAKHVFIRRIKPKEGDYFLCNVCTLQNSCRYYRVGAVCAVPDSEPTPLVKALGTRDSETIITGLQALLQSAAERYTRGQEMETEEDEGKLNPEVTKLFTALFDRGVVLAKLVNPALQKPGIQINHNTLNLSDPKQAMASVVAHIEAQGIPREDITPEMVQSVLQQGASQKAIEAHVIAESA